MILFIKNLMTNETRHYVLHSVEDFSPVFDTYPQTHEIALKSDNIEQAADNISKYLSHSSSFDSWVEDTGLQKGLKEKAAALGVAAALSFAHPSKIHTDPQMPKISEQEQTSEAPFGKSPEDHFLWNVMQVESSGGKNTEHPEIKVGPNKGDTAIGRWGLLKPTVHEIVNRMSIEGAVHPSISKLKRMDRETLKTHLEKNPHTELKLARYLARYTIGKHAGNHLKAAYAWLHGHNLDSNRITPDLLQGSDYVSKYKEYNKANPFKLLQSKKIKKSEENAKPFIERLKDWIAKRDEKNRSSIPKDTTYIPDPGRLREKSLDEVEDTSTDKGKLQQSIKQAKDSIKR